MTMFRCAILVSALLFSGCATKTVPVPVTVKVPVVVKCKASLPAKPELPFDSLAEDSTLFDKIQALLKQDFLLKAYSSELEVVAQACSEPPGSETSP